jgi:hypothetical protein
MELQKLNYLLEEQALPTDEIIKLIAERDNYRKRQALLESAMLRAIYRANPSASPEQVTEMLDQILAKEEAEGFYLSRLEELKSIESGNGQVCEGGDRP